MQRNNDSTINPFQRSGPSPSLSSSAGYERSELEEFPAVTLYPHYPSQPSPPLLSQHAVVSLQHHHQVLTSTHQQQLQLQPNIQDVAPEAGLLRLPSGSDEDGDDVDDAKLFALGGGDHDLLTTKEDRQGGRLARWCPPLRPPGRLLRRLTPHIPTSYPGTGSLTGYWFISAEQHILEFVLVNLAFAGLLVFFGIDLASHAPNKTPAEPTGTIIMYVLAGLLSLSFLYTICYKWMTKSLIFLLQPCHVITTVELFVLLSPHGSVLDMTIVFNLMLYWIWNPLIAMMQPDLRDYKHFRDIFNYFFQHVLIILIPFYILFTRQYDLYHWSWENLVVSFNLQVLYHFFVLEVVNFFAGTNLNYMMAPPPGPLEWFGSWYRVVMTILSFGLTVGQRVVLVDGGRWLLGNILYEHVFSYFP